MAALVPLSPPEPESLKAILLDLFVDIANSLEHVDVAIAAAAAHDRLAAFVM